MRLPSRSSVLLPLCLTACLSVTPSPPPPFTPAPTLDLHTINLDAETQALIAQADRVAFIIPFSHWDTDWHETFPAYVKRSDGNILAAIQMASQNPRFRYAFEQVLFVQHFWETYPEHRADLKALVQSRQLTFAWAGITQPETSLTAPAVQVRNLQLGQQWIVETFGPEYLPHTAWQSDAFGNSAAFPFFLTQSGISYLFIGRGQRRCDPDDQDCQPLPHAFYWRSPLPSSVGRGAGGEGRVLVAYLSYPSAWDAIHRLPTEGEQIAALRQYIESQFQRADSKYVFIPMGSDFIDPISNLQSLVTQWNAADQRTALVISDPETAFRYLATQNLPEFTVDLNPIWQAFYGSRPLAKIADKESEYFLTAADKFGLLLDAPPSSAWHTATVSAHYDNIGAVSFDWVWESTQRPRFEETVAASANDLAGILTRLASRVDAPLLVFNPTSWPRSEIIEIDAPADWPAEANLPAPVQTLGPHHFAFRATSVPPIGYQSPISNPPSSITHDLDHPAAIAASDPHVTLTNGLVSVTLDSARGGAFTHLSTAKGPNLLSGLGDDVTYWNDTGDIYGAFFGEVRARESDVPAQITVLADGPLIARVQTAFTLDGQPLTKTVTLRADSPLVEVALEMKALPETTAVVHTPTTIESRTRTDDLGFAAFTHEIDSRPIVSGDITYRRKIFYPITYWSDIAAADSGLALITHGLQGVAGTNTLGVLLVRQVSDEGREGLTDPDYHTLRYAYLPHAGPMADLPYLAYAFNQPLIPAWRAGAQVCVQLPFLAQAVTCIPQSPISNLPSSFSLLSAQSGIVADLYRQDNQVQAVVLDYDPATPVTLMADNGQIVLTESALTLAPLELKIPTR